MTGRPAPVEVRLWEKVVPAEWNECWLWTAYRNPAGYGILMVDGTPRRAHRLTFERLRAEIPEGLHLDHLCRVRACVNPWHLEPVTNAVNTARGRLSEVNGDFQRSKTHCRNGHPYDDENTRIDRNGWRRCRICENTQSLAGYYRRKARATA